MSRDITGHKQTRLPSKTLWKLFLYLHFHSYFKTTSPNCFNVFCKILLQSIFLARIIIKNKNKSKNSKISRTNAEATSGHPNATLKHSWVSRILYFALRRNKNTNESQLISEHILRSLRGKLAWLIYDMSLIKEKRPTLNRHSKPIPFPQNFSLDYFILLLFKFNVVSHTVVSYIYRFICILWWWHVVAETSSFDSVAFCPWMFHRIFRYHKVQTLQRKTRIDLLDSFDVVSFWTLFKHLHRFSWQFWLYLRRLLY